MSKFKSEQKKIELKTKIDYKRLNKYKSAEMLAWYIWYKTKKVVEIESSGNAGNNEQACEAMGNTESFSIRRPVGDLAGAMSSLSVDQANEPIERTWSWTWRI